MKGQVASPRTGLPSTSGGKEPPAIRRGLRLAVVRLADPAAELALLTLLEPEGLVEVPYDFRLRPPRACNDSLARIRKPASVVKMNVAQTVLDHGYPLKTEVLEVAGSLRDSRRSARSLIRRSSRGFPDSKGPLTRQDCVTVSR